MFQSTEVLCAGLLAALACGLGAAKAAESGRAKCRATACVGAVAVTIPPNWFRRLPDAFSRGLMHMAYSKADCHAAGCVPSSNCHAYGEGPSRWRAATSANPRPWAVARPPEATTRGSGQVAPVSRVSTPGQAAGGSRGVAGELPDRRLLAHHVVGYGNPAG